MTDALIELKLTDLGVKNTPATLSLRLLAEGKHVVLATLIAGPKATNLVSVMPIEDPGKFRSLFPLDSAFGLPSWDVIKPVSGGVAAVWTKPGSAFSPLGYRSPEGKEIVLTKHYPSGIFQKPRFVRGSPASGSAITAIAYQESGPIMAFFSDSRGDGNASYVPLTSAGAGTVEDGVLLRSDPDYFLLVKLRVPSAVTPDSTGRVPERKLGGGASAQPGIVCGLRLNAKFEPVGDLFRPFGDTPVFEFDADVNEGHMFLLVTTDKGYRCARSRKAGDILRWTASPDIPGPGDLTSPCVLATGSNRAAAAAIASASTQRAQILAGFISAQGS